MDRSWGVIGGFGAVVGIGSILLDVRNKQLVDVGTCALKKLESEPGLSLKIASEDDTGRRSRIASHTCVFRAIEGLSAAVFVAGAIWAHAGYSGLRDQSESSIVRPTPGAARRVDAVPSSVTHRSRGSASPTSSGLTRSITALTDQLAGLVAQVAPQLLAEPGLGVLLAAKFIGEIAGIDRFSSDAQLARLAGCAPIPVASGRTDRHRLDPA